MIDIKDLGELKPLKRSKRKREYGDRFIPCSKQMSFDLDKENSAVEANFTPETKRYADMLKKGLGLKSDRILTFSKPPELTIEQRIAKGMAQKPKRIKADKYRYIPKAPVRVLDAPDIRQDYYSNVMDWSGYNVLALGLGRVGYLWDGATAETTTFCDLEEEQINYDITSMSFSKYDPESIAVGLESGCVRIYDIAGESSGPIRNLRSHHLRGQAGSATFIGDCILATGCADGRVVIHDLRVKKHEIHEITEHEDEILSLAWCEEKNQLAIGSNDFNASVYDFKANKMRKVLVGHQAAVKGLTWSQDGRFLLTGGGRVDGTMRVWNTCNWNCSTKKLGGSISGIRMSQDGKEIIASVGNEVNIYTFPDISLCKKLDGHTEKVLSMSLSPCGTTTVTCAGDETVKFWRVFEARQKKKIKSPLNFIR